MIIEEVYKIRKIDKRQDVTGETTFEYGKYKVTYEEDIYANYEAAKKALRVTASIWGEFEWNRYVQDDNIKFITGNGESVVFEIVKCTLITPE